MGSLTSLVQNGRMCHRKLKISFKVCIRTTGTCDDAFKIPIKFSPKFNCVGCMIMPFSNKNCKYYIS